jgi:parallel beta-helix repeat protein
MNHLLLRACVTLLAGILLMGALTPAVAAAGTYYVSPNGNDANPGTEVQPWQSAAKAAESAQAGDTVYFMEGVYPGVLRPRHSGTPGNPITFTSYPGQTATIDGGKSSKGPFGGVVDIHGKSHIVVSNLRVVNGEHFGIRVSESEGILIQNNVTDFTFASGIYLASSRQVIVDGNEVRRACHGVGGRPPQEHITVRGGMDGFEIRNNRVHILHNGEGKEGINIKEGVRNGKVYNNIVEGMSRTGLYVDAFDAYVENIEIYGNVVTNSLHGIVVASERRGTVSNIAIYNNLFYNNNHHGIWVTHYLDGGPMTNIRIVNNTIYNNVKRGIVVSNPEATGLLVRNNIVLNNGESQIYVDPEIPPVTVDHNLTEGDSTFMNPQRGDFRLQPTSLAVDAGTHSDAPTVDFAGNGRPHGRAHDQGAFELTGIEFVGQIEELFLPLVER